MSELSTTSQNIHPIRYTDIFDKSPSYDDLIDKLRSTSRLLTLDILSSINCYLHNIQGQLDPQVQKRILGGLSTGLPYSKQIEMLLDHRHHFVYGEQLAVLSKYVLLHSPLNDTTGLNNDALVRSLLMISSFRLDEVAVNAGKPEEFVNLELAGAFGFADPLTHNVDRYSKFFDWVGSETAHRSSNWCPIPQDIEATFGITWLEYMAAGFTVWAFYRQIDTFEKAVRVRPLFDFVKDLPGSKNRVPIDTWRRLNVWPAEDLRELFAKDKPPHFTGHRLLPLWERPLISSGESSVRCPHLPLLENAVATGLFYRLVGHYQDQDEKKSGKARALFGEFFEDHVLGIIQRAAKGTGTKVFPEQLYGKNNERSSDVAVFYDNEAIFIEVTWSRLNLKETLAARDPKAIDEDLERIICKARQLNRCVRDFRNGKISYIGIDNRAIRKIYPVLVNSYSLPQLIGLISEIDKRLKSEMLLQTTERIQIVEVHSMELLEPYLEKTIGLNTLLRRKLEKPATAAMSMMNFLYTNATALGMPEKLEKPHHVFETTERVREVALSWGPYP